MPYQASRNGYDAADMFPIRGSGLSSLTFDKITELEGPARQKESQAAGAGSQEPDNEIRENSRRCVPVFRIAFGFRHRHYPSSFFIHLSGPLQVGRCVREEVQQPPEYQSI